MATVGAESESRYGGSADEFRTDTVSFDQLLLGAFRALGSLKLTVALFAISSVLILVGTLAQDEMNMLQVKQRYFTSWITLLHFDDFVPQAFYRHDTPLHIPLPGTAVIPGVPFPGGALIGTLLLLNLIAAKVTRFHAQARGGRLAAGLLFLIAGLGLTLLIVATGHSAEGLQGQPPFSYDALWVGVCGAVAVTWMGMVAASIAAPRRGFRLLSVTAAAIIGLTLIAMLSGYATLNEPGLRILWQLIKGLGCAAVLLVGCLLIFGRQGGNVLLHFGVALLMIGQFAYGDRQLEQRLSLIEGETTNTLLNLDAVELAFIDPSQEGKKVVTSIPVSRLQEAAETGQPVRDPALPVDLRVVDYMPHSRRTEVTEENPADSGMGRTVMVEELTPEGGTSSDINAVSAYVQLIDKQNGKPLGTYLASQLFNEAESLFVGGKNSFDDIQVDDKQYQLSMRFRRVPKPYWVKLDDVRRINYSGSQTPRDYSSFIRLVDPETGEDRREHIWMNNPLRYRGETFYQSNYTSLPDGREMTGLQVVRNSGWLIPYVACVIVGLGMLVHFLGTLNRYLGRREREAKKQAAVATPSDRPAWPIVAGVALVGVVAVMQLVPWSAVMMAYRPVERQSEIDYYRMGEIPVQFGGRVMPLDAYARQTLKAISKKESLPLERAPTDVVERAGGGKKLSALQWLMEVATDSEGLEAVPMFRIDAAEVLAEMGLQERDTKLYSLSELRKNYGRFLQLVEAAREKDEATLSFKEKKLVELDDRIRIFTLASAAFRLPTPPQIDPATRPEEMAAAQMGAFQDLMRNMEMLKRMNAPAIIPPTREQTDTSVDHPRWSAFSNAFFDASIERITGNSPEASDPTTPFAEMITAYRESDAAAFNEAVDDQLTLVQAAAPADYLPWRVELERWMEAAWPTGVATILYIIALVLGLVYMLADLPRLRWTVWWILALTLVIHTVVIVCRIVITGKPPVINLYSSAVFIGWAAVLAGLVMERLSGRGIGNLLAASTGVLTLRVAYGLNAGDTMPVLQAVLDTDFWLGTHVISVTLGYAATFVAGALGIGYLIAGWTRADASTKHELYRMTYGVACFGILFSFIGTVLGGLWADDSWGRFWGWDPKENGALLIVIWNALMLHARWDRMVGPRGFAMLAVGGNIVTAWSWFGTNQLGIGLHSYGFTSGVMFALMTFVASQLALIAAAWFYWPASTAPEIAEPTDRWAK